MNGIEPELQRVAPLFERGANRWVQVMAAPLAGIGALLLDPIPVRKRASIALAEPNPEQVLQTVILLQTSDFHLPHKDYE